MRTDRTMEALRREAAVVSSLSHPSIQRLLEATLTDPDPHLVLEYVEGPTLASLLDSEGPLGPPDVIRLGMQVAAALHYLHGRGVVHLDLKPSNLALSCGRAVLLDFDIALPVGGSRPSRTPRGTPAYMAPEQVRMEPAAPSMDLWALGTVLFEAATGEPAFDVADETGKTTRYTQLATRPAFPQSCTVPAALRELIVALTEPRASNRPASAEEVLRLLASGLPEAEEGLWPDWVGVALSSMRFGKNNA
jgi:serine/threonine protein kinase